MSEDATLPSSLIRAHAPDQNPPASFGLGLVSRSLQVAAGPCWEMVLPGVIPANPYMGAWTLTPRRFSGAFTRFFPENIGLTLDLRRSAHRFIPTLQLQWVTYFEAAVIPLCSGSHVR